jgi:multiple sugar transport system permease protein
MRKLLRTAAWYLLAGLVSFALLLPFFWMISTSLKTQGALMALPVQWLPARLTFDSYVRVFELVPFVRAVANTAVVAVATCLITVTTSAMAAFAFARLRFRGRNALFGVYLATLMIPGQVTTIPLFLVLSAVGLIGTFQGLLLPALFNAFAVFLLRQHMQTIPQDFLDAAKIDGAGLGRVFRSVAMPLSRPIVAALVVILFMTAWNDYFWPLVILTDQAYHTLTLVLSQLNGQYSTRYNILMAGSLLSMIPILVVYAAAQKYFQSGLQLGGIKG